MRQAKKGDKVSIHYVGSFDDGTVIDSTRNRDPFLFTIGKGEVIPGFESAVIGLSVGDIITVALDPEDAYGQRREDFVIKVRRSDVPPQITPEIGMELTLNEGENEEISFHITEITRTHLTLDANHPLAGKKLFFEIELVSIE